MREIKFRAWDKTGKNMIVDYAHLGQFGELYTTCFHESAYNDSGCPELALIQYTGLKDKNNIEIYEGDIIKKGKAKFNIEFRDGAFEMIGINIISVARMSHNYRDTEIIGNKFENPELMK